MSIVRKNGVAQIPLLLVLPVLAISLPMATTLIEKNTENRSKAASCDEYCAEGPVILRSCHPSDADGTSNDSGCYWPGRVESCGSNTTYYCCTNINGVWQKKMTDECRHNLVLTGVITATPAVGPTFTSLVVKSSDGQTVNIDSLDRLQNCQDEIISSSRPGELRFTATISDPDGWSDISAISLRWGTSGSGTAMTLAPGSGNVRTANLTVDLSTWSYATTTKPLQVIATDSFGLTTNWISSHKLKYWNCKLPVSGTIYDAAGGGQVCATGAGFLTPVTTKFNFQGIGYTEVSPKISSVPMLATLPATYTSSGGNDLLWGRDYQPKFNKDIQGTSQLIRMIDRGDAGVTGVSCFATNQITLIDGKVNPYSTNPRVQIDYSFITNQEPWFQVAGAGVLAANRLETNVPVTCPLIAGCKPATAINSTSASGGILSAIEVETNSGCSLSGPCRYGETNNWVKESVILSAEDRPTYRTIYNQYLANKGVGVTIEGNTTMSTITAKSSGVGGTGVVFVNGNLSVNVNNTVSVGEFLMIVVKGGITFEKNVTKNEGIFMADGGIRTVGLSNNQLVINGVLYSGINAPTGNIRFIRGFTDKSDNNGQPATVVNYRPDLIFNMPGKVSQVLTGWKTAL